MLVQTRTKEKPTSVLQHRAGGWNFGSVPPIVYIGFALVSNSSCPVSIASCTPPICCPGLAFLLSVPGLTHRLTPLVV